MIFLVTLPKHTHKTNPGSVCNWSFFLHSIITERTMNCVKYLLQRKIQKPKRLPLIFNTFWLRISDSAISTALRQTSKAFLMSPATAATFLAQNWTALFSTITSPFWLCHKITYSLIIQIYEYSPQASAISYRKWINYIERGVRMCVYIYIWRNAEHK